MDAKNSGSAGYRSIVPACSIEEDSGIVTVKVEMPGMPKEGLEVKIEGNALAIEGKRSGSGLEGNYLVRERRTEDFRKVFTIDESIDRDKVEAELAEGILTLKLHQREAAKPRRIAVA
jgi:HSP20 family protein